MRNLYGRLCHPAAGSGPRLTAIPVNDHESHKDAPAELAMQLLRTLLWKSNTRRRGAGAAWRRLPGRFPAAGHDSPSTPDTVTIQTTYQLINPLFMFWPGAGSVTATRFTVGATSTQEGIFWLWKKNRPAALSGEPACLLPGTDDERCSGLAAARKERTEEQAGADQTE